MTADPAPRDDTFDSLIVQGLAMRDAGFAARRADVFTLRDQGHRPPAIADELQRRARAAGRTDAEIDCLGLSVHNVRLILREWPDRVAEQDAENVQ